MASESQRPAVLALIALLGWALNVQAAPAPIVFDFEDGLQGWELRSAAYQSPSSAQRVQTQVLGGEWAIFGDGVLGGASMSIEVDLTDIASITVEQFYISGDENGLHALVVGDRPAVQGGAITFPQFDVVESGNPSLRTISVGSLTGMGLVEITWEESFPNVGHPSVAAFIDNITFHPVPESSSRLLAPEPSSWLLLSLGIAGMVMIRRKLASGA